MRRGYPTAHGADRLLIRPTGGPGRCRHPGGHVKRRARRSGQMRCESRRVTGTEPAGPPPRSTATTLTDAVSAWHTGDHVVVAAVSEDEEGDFEWGGEGVLASILPVRAELSPVICERCICCGC